MRILRARLKPDRRPHGQRDICPAQLFSLKYVFVCLWPKKTEVRWPWTLCANMNSNFYLATFLNVKFRIIKLFLLKKKINVHWRKNEMEKREAIRKNFTWNLSATVHQTSTFARQECSLPTFVMLTFFHTLGTLSRGTKSTQVAIQI